MEGWIKLHRQLINWEWFDDHNVFRLFIFLLLNANHTAKKWKGIDIDKGQYLTGRLKLSSVVGLTEQQIRSCLNKLKSTNEITIKSTSLYSIITVNNWESYQQSNQQSNQQITNEQPTDNQRITTTKNDKNVENENNDKNITPDHQEINDILNLYAEIHKRKYRQSHGIRLQISRLQNQEGYSQEDWREIFEKSKNGWVIEGKQIIPNLDKILENSHKILNDDYNLKDDKKVVEEERFIL